MEVQQHVSERRLHVLTNFFEIKTLPTKPFYHYDVITKKDPKGDKPCPRARCAQIVDKMQDGNPAIFSPRASYDGYKNMFSSRRLDNGVYPVAMSPHATKGVFEVKITRVNVIDTSVLSRYTTGDGAADFRAQQDTIPITLLQVIISQGPHIAHNFSLHAKSFYNSRDSFNLSPGIQGWRGFFQSVRPVLHRFLVNVDTTAAAFYQHGKLIDIACGVARIRDTRTLIDRMNTDERVLKQLRSFFKNVFVSIQPNGVRKKITNFVPYGCMEKFDLDGTEISVAEYWEAHHNVRLRHPQAFGVQCAYSDAIFPPEICEIIPGQRYKRKLSPEDTNTFIQLAKTNPNKRLNDIMSAVRGTTLNYAHSPWMIEAGMEVATTPVEVVARQLDPPRVEYGGGIINVPGGSWNVMNQRLKEPGHLGNRAVVVFDTGGNWQARVFSYLDQQWRNIQKLGINFSSQEPTVLPCDPQNPDAGLFKVWEASAQGRLEMYNGKPIMVGGKAMPERPKCILVILPKDAAEIRKAVKQFGNSKWGIPTQCVRGGKYDESRGRDQYCNNIALKINAKLGGVNSHVKSPTADKLFQDALFIGCDVAHPAPGVYNRPSIASLVSSVDGSATRYLASVSVQAPRQEIIEEVDIMLEEALNFYNHIRRQWPRAIVIYRDGVSEGEYRKVEEEEISKIEDKLKEKFNGKPPYLVFIVVGKRHHARFFPMDKSQSDRSGNCLPGTVVDSTIVHSKYPDFYLLSHSGLVGTSRPAHYVVLKNTAGLAADKLQELSNALCYVYATSTRAVSIPTPVYYADRLCASVSDFQFNPKVYEDDDSSDGKRGSFPLQKWKQALAKSPLHDRMYFL